MYNDVIPWAQNILLMNVMGKWKQSSREKLSAEEVMVGIENISWESKLLF
jgi:hypothetical protein